MNDKEKNCEHFVGVNENVTPKTPGCEECEKERTDWVALRMCSICGHVGCCDSSVVLHATEHFNETRHPIMVAIPNRQRKWCYEHKQYS